VYLFFVHTSLVLMLSLERQQAKSPDLLAATFYIRRFFRIYPLSILAVVCVTLFSIPAKNVAGFWTIAQQPPQAFNIASNLALVMNLTGSIPIIGQLWSLPLEVQMYVLLPPLFFVARRFGPKAILLLWGLATICASVLLVVEFPSSWRLSLAQYLPDFLPGILAYTLWRSRPHLPSWLWLPGLIAWSALYYSFFHIHKTQWLFCLAVGLAIPRFHQVSNRWLVSAGHYIAKFSYGIYLSHVFCLWLAFNAIRAPFALQVSIWLAALVAIPVAAFYWLEAPAICAGIRIGDAFRRELRHRVRVVGVAAPLVQAQSESSR
jgi:peptidoglycan/LPS O-acetylase OafA/YrhL